MLEQVGGLIYAREIHNDWKQSLEEGKDIAHLEAVYLAIKDLANENPLKVQLAESFYQSIQSAPTKKGFKYKEPSDLEGIRKQRPEKVKLHKVTKDMALLYDKFYGAWLGRVAGCLLGKPVEGWRSDRFYPLIQATGNYPLKEYISMNISAELKEELKLWDKSCWIENVTDSAPVDDDTNYTVMGMKVIETYGKNFRPADVAEGWLYWMPLLASWTAERVAYRNLSNGMLPPETATHQNPYREWIGAQIRADFFGYINPGNTEMAAEMAWRDASISHIKNGIYGEMFVAAMLAAAAVSDDILTVLSAGLSEIPERSRLAERVKDVIGWYKSGVSKEDARAKIHTLYDEHDGHDWCHTISNAMIVVMGLLYGEKDFGKSICIAVDACFDTDCNGATVGSILGMMLGARKIPAYWTKPFQDTLNTSIDGYHRVKISDMAKKTIELYQKD